MMSSLETVLERLKDLSLVSSNANRLIKLGASKC